MVDVMVYNVDTYIFTSSLILSLCRWNIDIFHRFFFSIDLCERHHLHINSWIMYVCTYTDNVQTAIHYGMPIHFCGRTFDSEGMGESFFHWRRFLFWYLKHLITLKLLYRFKNKNRWYLKVFQYIFFALSGFRENWEKLSYDEKIACGGIILYYAVLLI